MSFRARTLSEPGIRVECLVRDFGRRIQLCAIAGDRLKVVDMFLRGSYRPKQERRLRRAGNALIIFARTHFSLDIAP